MKAKYILAFALCGLSATAFAQRTAEDDTLTGDWGGVRTTLAEHGMVTELSTTGYYAGLLSGSGDKDFEFGGRSDALIHLNTGKLGLWDGGGFHFHVESRYGDSADRTAPRSGGLWPPNTGVVLPLGDAGDVAVSSIYYSHGFNENASLLIGKINAVDLLAADPFFGGWARDRFTNIAFVAPPSGVVPPTIMGGIFSYKFKPFSLTLMAFDPNDQTNEYRVDQLFEDGVNLSLGGTWSGEIAGRASSLNVTATYSTKEGADLSEVLLPANLKTGNKKGSYNVAFGFSHLLYELADAPGKGFGMYGKGAIADGNPNPIQSSFVSGFAGHGVVPARPDDVFGIGYYFYNLSDDLQAATGPVFPIDDEQGIEVYYNLAVTPWFHLTADVQWIAPANARAENAWVGGLRANVTF